jgi:hypothetical protein
LNLLLIGFSETPLRLSNKLIYFHQSKKQIDALSKPFLAEAFLLGKSHSCCIDVNSASGSQNVYQIDGNGGILHRCMPFPIHYQSIENKAPKY